MSALLLKLQKSRRAKTPLHHTWNLPSIFHCHQRNEMNQHDKKANEKTSVLLCRVCFAAFDFIIICLLLVHNYSRGFTDDWPTSQQTFMDTYKRMIPDFCLIYYLVSFFPAPSLFTMLYKFTLLSSRPIRKPYMHLKNIIAKKNLAFLFHLLLDHSRRNSSFYWL